MLPKGKTIQKSRLYLKDIIDSNLSNRIFSGRKTFQRNICTQSQVTLLSRYDLWQINTLMFIKTVIMFSSCCKRGTFNSFFFIYNLKEYSLENI